MRQAACSSDADTCTETAAVVFETVALWRLETCTLWLLGMPSMALLA